MIEIIIKNFLDTHLSVSSFLEKKGKMPLSYVLFEKQVVARAITFYLQHLRFRAMLLLCMKQQS